MNDRSAEKLHIINTALSLAGEKNVEFAIVCETSEWATEAYYFEVRFRFNKHRYTATSYDVSHAIFELFEAANKSGLLKDVIVG